MELFTLWDARGRRLPLLIVLVLVLGGYAAAKAVAAPVPVARVFLKSDRDAKEQCHLDEVFSRSYWRCEGWWGGACRRQSLSQPNYVYCWPDYFMSKWNGKAHRECHRRVRYYAPDGKSIRYVRRGSTNWRCIVTAGGPPS